MLDKKLMKLFITNPDVVRRAILTENQASIMEEIMEFDYPTISTRELADSRRISAQNASSQLVTLWHKGYLTREERIAETGGIEYRYKSTIK